MEMKEVSIENYMQYKQSALQKKDFDFFKETQTRSSNFNRQEICRKLIDKISEELENYDTSLYLVDYKNNFELVDVEEA